MAKKNSSVEKQALVEKQPHGVYSKRRNHKTGLLVGTIALYSLYSIYNLSRWYLSLSVDERIRIMVSVEQAFEAINAAVDGVTTAAADEIARANAALAAVIAANPRVDVDATPILNRLKAVEDNLRNTTFQTVVDSDPNLSNATGISQSGTSGATGESVGASNPEEGNSEGNSAASTTATPQIGVSDSDNPQSTLTPAPLGTPQVVPVENQAPTDAVVAQVNSNPNSPDTISGGVGQDNGPDPGTNTPDNRVATTNSTDSITGITTDFSGSDPASTNPTNPDTGDNKASRVGNLTSPKDNG